MLQQAKQYLHTYFGYSEFRKGQEQAIESVLQGENTICVMPTGGGKSICYQIPALVLDGLTIVVSPLISLMKDQVDALLQVGISATYINSSISAKEAGERLFRAKEGQYKLLYIAPERLESYAFVEELKRMNIPLVAVDEAHCISQWGHDFRPSYRYIQSMVQQLPSKPIIMALTATATPNVRDDICHLLHINEKQTVMTGFERENLTFSVVKGQDRLKYLQSYIKNNQNEAGIIYAATRKAVDKLYDLLVAKGVQVGKYHAGMSDADRSEEQERFLQDDTTVMVATSAFGMGIDKSNIRYVVHFQLPKNMESYYQEAGRAGRDGLPSECTLLYSSQDVQVQRYLIDQSSDRERMTQELEKLQFMVDYCHTENCLQQYITSYFGETNTEACERCSNCTDQRTSFDITKETQMILSCVIRMGQKKYGKTLTAQVLTGSQNQKIKQFGFEKLTTYGILKDMSAKQVSDLMEYLISQEIVGVEHGQYPTLYVPPKGKDILLGKATVSRKEAVVETKKIAVDHPLFDALRSLRREIAEREGVPPFVIFSDSSLKDMCAKLPRTGEEFLQVNGVGELKLKKYGEEFLQAITGFLEENPVPESEGSMEVKPVRKAAKKEKDSHKLTLELFHQGLGIKDISQKRELSITTVENHLLQCAEQGLDIDLAPLVPAEAISLIQAAIEVAGNEKLKPIKENVPDEISYFMIKVFLFLQRQKQMHLN
ncbi:DNA helicase RecQ [Cytobacillus spongiae]|uniref:DNA helicase RecQ n=1 Tax=Cytobacillus spongiae TaxID=2901381 RepID=UPI001F2FA90E|nr:DNA helicase RecQ [Cytobacillus spongiae]UII57730.1 DNA helicase RecQ [Cytobacillus spongiae]